MIEYSFTDMTIPPIWGDIHPPGTTVLMKSFPVELTSGEYVERATLVASVSGLVCQGTGATYEQV